MKIFFDSSALVKRYIEETGSKQVIELCDKANEISVSIICITEVLSAANRCLREKKISRDQYLWIKSEFLLDMGEFAVIDLTNDVIIRSIQCLEKGALRSLDALHIASALENKCLLFVTSDIRQIEIVEKMGLKAEMV